MAAAPTPRTFEFDLELSKTAIKTTLAAVASIYICRHLLHEHSAIWAVISAILVTQSNLGSSIKVAWVRGIGTLVGAAFGVFCAQLMNAHFWSQSLSILGTLLVCLSIRPLREVSRLAAVTAAMFFANELAHSEPVRFGLERVAGIGIGIAVGLTVGSMLWPARANQQACDTVAKLFAACGRLYDLALDRHLGSTETGDLIESMKTEISASIRSCRQLVEDGRNEPEGNMAYADLEKRLQDGIRLYRNVLLLERAAARIPARDTNDPFHSVLKDLKRTTSLGIAQAAEAISLRKPLPAQPEMAAALWEAEKALDNLRRGGIATSRALDLALHRYAIFYSMRSIAEDLLADIGTPAQHYGSDLIDQLSDNTIASTS